MSLSMGKRFLQSVSVICMLADTSWFLLLSCCLMEEKLILASALSFASVILLEILWGLFILVKGKPFAESVQLRCHKIKMWQTTDQIRACLWVICVWSGKRSSTRLASWAPDSPPPWNPLRLLDFPVHSNWAFLCHFLWSSLMSYTTSAFPTVSSTALGTLRVAFTDPAGVVPRCPLWAIRNSWAELKDNSSANHILRVLSLGKCAETKQACGF